MKNMLAKASQAKPSPPAQPSPASLASQAQTAWQPSPPVGGPGEGIPRVPAREGVSQVWSHAGSLRPGGKRSLATQG